MLSEWHSPLAGADIGSSFSGQPLGVREGFATEVSHDEGGGEGIPRADGVDDVDVPDGLRDDFVSRNHFAAVGTPGQDDQPEAAGGYQRPRRSWRR